MPLTSMPLIIDLLGSDSVASPSLLFLVILVGIWMIPGFFSSIRFSRDTLPLSIFTIAAFIISLLSFFLKIPPFKGFRETSPVIGGIATLLLGVAFFTTASSFPGSSDLKKKTLQIINWSGMLILLWALVQAISWYTLNRYPLWMFEIQGFLSRRVLYRQRVTGFALEPSWLAHQLNLLYLPFWLSAFHYKYTSHRFRILGISFESFLLLGGLSILLLTFSRVGYAAFLGMCILIVLSNYRNWIISLEESSFINKIHIIKWISAKRIVFSFLMFVIFLAIIVLGLFLFSKVDPRMAELFRFFQNDQNSILEYFNELKFGDRVIYWLTGWNIFNDNPVMGVGLGNAGFFFQQKIPSYGWSLVEVRKLMNRTSVLLNIKNLWVRLLAETGIIGFALFIGWLISLIATLLEKKNSENKLSAMLGFSGWLILVALIFEGFSVDSFAMPYWWVSLGFTVSINDQRFNIIFTK